MFDYSTVLIDVAVFAIFYPIIMLVLTKLDIAREQDKRNIVLTIVAYAIIKAVMFFYF